MSYPQIVAHRGNGVFPENSLAAFAQALTLPVEQIELDVHLSCDNALVVIHDTTLDQTSFGTGRIIDHSLAQLTATRLRGVDEVIPTLDQVLSLSAPSGKRTRIEVKPDARPGAYDRTTALVSDAIERFGIRDRVTVMSFDAKALADFAKAGLNTSLSCGQAALADAATFAGVLARARDLGLSDCGLTGDRTTAEILDMVRGAGLTAGIWTVNAEPRLHYWLRQPVDYILTDVPALALRLRSELLCGS